MILKVAKEKKGITLIALVITIIVLLILAGISISMLTGQNGILNRAQEAKEKTEEAKENELRKLTALEAATNSENQPYTDKNGDTATIPAGFAVSQIEGEQTVKEGLVVIDSYGNEFVWVPVKDLNTMFIEKTGTELSGKVNGVTVTTDLYSKIRIKNGDSHIADKPGGGNVREPDILMHSTFGDAATEDSSRGIEQLKSVLEIKGNTDIEVLNNFAKLLVNEYNATYQSIKKYNGFYIGRYELTGTIENPTVKRGKDVITNQNWYNLKKACTNVISTDKVQSTMIYGNEWDEIMNWLIVTGDKTETQINIDPTDWGNFIDSTGNAAKGSGIKQISGNNEAWKANNIYDLAGNCWEWTQEAIYNSNRIIRGGSYVDSGLNNTTSHRGNNPAYIFDTNGSSRPALYMY